MSFATPGSRSANYTHRILGLVVAGTSAGLFALLAVIFWFFGSYNNANFFTHWMQITMPGWPVTVLIIAAVQAVRTLTTRNLGRSWPWVIPVFAFGMAADFLLKQNDLAMHLNRVAASAIIATIVYVFFFTRWFSGK